MNLSRRLVVPYCRATGATVSIVSAFRLTTIVVTFLSATETRAGDWPQWRGPTQDAVAQGEDLAESWPADGPALLWTRELGQGYSAFAVANGRAYTQAQSLYQQALVCLDADSGETLWSHRYGWPYDGGGLYPGPRATPTIAEGLVYFAAPNGLIGCVDAESGAPVWSVNFKEKYGGRGTDFGVSASPVVWKDKVILPVGGPGASLVAVNAKTGDLVWKCGDLPASYATPIVVPFGDRWLVIAPLENSLLAADAETGQRLWELDLSAGYDEHSAAPLYQEPFLMLAAPFRSGAKLFRLIAEPQSTGCRAERVWDSAMLSNDIASSVLVGDHLYGFDLREPQSKLHRPSRGHFRCLNWADGTVCWSSSKPGQANVIVAGDKLLLFNDRGELHLCRASPESYQELAKASVFPGEICWTPPALSEGRVYLRTQTRAACLFVGRHPLPSDRPARTVATIPRVTTLVSTSLLGAEREFPAATPEWRELRSWYTRTAAAIVLVWLASWLVWAAGFAAFRLARIKNMASCWSDRAILLRHGLYWIGVLAFGAFGSALINPRQPEFLFTWPLALWALMQLATESSVWAVQQRGHRFAGWQARGMILLFIVGCGLYFHLCRRLGMATEWTFLIGIAAACPLAMLVDRQTRRLRAPRVWLSLPAYLLSYSVYFWFSVLIMKWHLRVGS